MTTVADAVAAKIDTPYASPAPGRWARFWVNSILMPAAARFPMALRSLARPGAIAAWITAPRLRRTLQANADRLLPAGATARDRRRFGISVLRHHYQFIVDIAQAQRATLRDYDRQIEATTGIEHFHRARQMGRGLIFATAHLGSFEVGVAALRREIDTIHIVFKRDPFPAFEAARRDLHDLLGVREAPIDDGFETWLRLRNALERDEAVLIQADRAMPGQRTMTVPFLGGTTRLPAGPFRLAELTGAPILPVFAPRNDHGRVKIRIEPPILVGPGASAAAAETFAQLAEACVREYGDQWLCLHPICREDQV